MDKDQEWAEIKSLRTAIEGAAFEKQTFRFEKKAEEESQLYSKKAVDRAWKAFNDRRSEKAIKERGKPIHRLKPGLVYYKQKHSHKKEPRELAFCSRIRIFDPKTKRFVRSVPFKSSLNKTSHLDVFDLAEKVDTFLWELTEKIWRHKQAATPEAGRRLIEDDKERVLRVLKATRGDLERYGYSKKAIREAMQILKRDLDKRLERAREMKDHKYFVKTGPLDHPWIERENDLIRDIRSLYKKYTPLSGRKIDASIAVIFAATDFWTDDKDEEQGDQAGLDRIAVYFERLRKRKAPEDAKPPELFDPPQNIR